MLFSTRLARFSVRAGLACACASSALFAQAQAPGGVPAMRGEGAARYVCGGIGSDESTAMRAAMKDHPLSLLFARADGAYLSDIAVSIKEPRGATVLSMSASGPVCLVDLPAGRYTVEATAEGTSKRQDVTLGTGAKTADFRF